MLRRACPMLVLVLPALLLASCGMRPAGYGVVLWGDFGGAPSTGSVVPVVSDAPINSSYLIQVPGDRKPREYPMGRIRFFRRKGDADAFLLKSFSPYLQTWAISMKQDPPPLPIRSQPSQDALVIYKLRPGQLVKVVGRSSAPEAIQQFSDYWYEVVTQDGFDGYCFGHYLKTFTTDGDPSLMAQSILSQDPTLDLIMSNTWRPDWFRDQLARGAIDLSVFRQDVGLFPDPVNKVVHLVLPQYSLDFPYTGIQKLGESTYVFTGSDLRVQVLDPQRISIYYHYKDQRVAGLYTLLSQDVGDLITAEQKRRQDIFNAILAHGSSLSSSAYGTITLSADMRFSWTGYQKLVPSLVPAGAAGKGQVDFPLHAARSLAGDYDGVITFVFDHPGGGAAGSGGAGGTGGAAAGSGGAGGAGGTSGAPAGSGTPTPPPSPAPVGPWSVSFLYKVTSGGLRFTSLDPDSVSNLIVSHPGISPVVIFFSQSR